MYDHKIHYCFTLSEEQMKYLRSKKYKIDRMECFLSLVELAERETKLVQISKTQQIEILPGQVMVDNTQLAKLWGKDRKTVPKLIEAMAEGWRKPHPHASCFFGLVCGWHVCQESLRNKKECQWHLNRHRGSSTCKGTHY